MQLETLVDDLALEIRDPVFRHGRGGGVELSLEQALRTMIGKHFGDGRFGLAFGQFELGVLEIENRTAERLAALHIFDGLVNCTLNHADALKADYVALLRQFLHQLDEALALDFAKKVGSWHTHFIKEQLRCIRSMLANLFKVPAAAEAFHLVCLDNGNRNALGALGRVRLHANEDQVCGLAIRDEGLRAIDDVFAAIALGGRFHALQVRACTGLRHRNGGYEFARTNAGQPTPLLFFGAIGDNIGCNNRIVQGYAESVDTLPLLLFDDDGFMTEITTRAAIFFGHGCAEQAHFASLFPDFHRNNTVLAPLGHMRHAFLFEELANSVRENLELFVLAPIGLRDI